MNICKLVLEYIEQYPEDEPIFIEDIKKYVVRKCLYKRDGDKVERFDNASKCLGIIFMRFESEEIMNNVLKSINEKIQVQLK